MKLLTLIPCVLLATGCAVVPSHPTVYGPGPVVVAPGPVYAEPIYAEPIYAQPVYVQPYPVYAPRRWYGPHDHGRHHDRHHDGRRDRDARVDRGGAAPARRADAGPPPTRGQIAAQRANPNMRFERPGMGGNWAATQSGWGWSPAAVDRP